MLTLMKETLPAKRVLKPWVHNVAAGVLAVVGAAAVFSVMALLALACDKAMAVPPVDRLEIEVIEASLDAPPVESEGIALSRAGAWHYDVLVGDEALAVCTDAERLMGYVCIQTWQDHWIAP